MSQIMTIIYIDLHHKTWRSERNYRDNFHLLIKIKLSLKSKKFFPTSEPLSFCLSNLNAHPARNEQEVATSTVKKRTQHVPNDLHNINYQATIKFS